MILERWSKPLNEPNWERAWGAFDSDQLVGHLDLRARDLATSLHRATLGMGILRSHQRAGLGKALIETALIWAKEQATLAWIDLNVFAHNEPALHLYQKFGFTKIGRIDDLFRIDGETIDDIMMTLQLPKGGGHP